MSDEILLSIRVGTASAAPARVARRLAGQLDARVTVLYVATELKAIDMVGTDGMILEDEQTRVVEQADAELATFVAEHLADVRTTVRIEAGPVADVVARIAREIGATYIVVGTRGRGALARLVLGDTTQSILQHTPCPVVVVPLEADATS